MASETKIWVLKPGNNEATMLCIESQWVESEMFKEKLSFKYPIHTEQHNMTKFQ